MESTRRRIVNWAMGQTASSDNFAFSSWDGSTLKQRLSVADTGNVGIGSTTPTVSLDLSQQTDAVALPSGVSSLRPTGVNGMIRYNSTLPGVEAYVNGAWTTLLSALSGTALSDLTGAIAVNTIDSATYAQTWTWNTLTTQNALTLSSTSETSGSLLTLTRHEYRCDRADLECQHNEHGRRLRHRKRDLGCFEFWFCILCRQ